MEAALPAELLVLAASVALLLVHVFAQAVSADRDTGLAHNIGPRDEEKPHSVLTRRLDRAKRNFLETYPALVALALALALSGRTGGWGAAGAGLWLAARVLYLPLYAFGVPVARSVAWFASIAGLLMMLGRLLFASAGPAA